MRNEHASEPMWRRYLRLVRPNIAGDVDDELRFHFEMLVNELEARGMSVPDARRAARERFGDGEKVGRWLRAHDERLQRTTARRLAMTSLSQHLRFVVRALLRQPAFTVAAVLTLALGIGSTTAIFGVVNAVLLEPLPFRDAEQLVGLWHSSPIMGATLAGQSYHSFDTYRRLNRTVDDIALFEQTAVNVAEPGSRPERVPAAKVTASHFPALRVRPLLGRVFTAEEDRPGRASVVMIGESLWRTRFGSANDVIGRRLRVDGVSSEIIGVVADRERFPQGETQLWLPLALDPNGAMAGAFRYSAIGRLRSGATPESAARDFQRVLPAMATLHPIAFPGVPTSEILAGAHPLVVVHPLRDDVVGDVGRVLWVVLGTVGFVLLAACANIANLSLARAEARRGELAVRAALGAGRGDALVRFLIEGLVLAIAGALIGVALASVGLASLRGLTTLPIPRLDEVRLDGRVLGMSAIVTLFVAIATSALPMLRVGASDLAPLLRAGGRGATRSRERRRVQRTLVAAQVALAFVLLASCTLMARTFISLRHVHPGFDSAHALTFRIALPEAGYADGRAVLRLYDEVTERLGRIPGVTAVGATSWRPLDNSGRNLTNVSLEGEDANKPPMPARPIVLVTPSYFRAIGIPLVAGRGFRGLLEANGETEAIVSATFAAQILADAKGTSVIGRRIRLLSNAPWLTIIGMVGAVRDASLDQEPLPIVYLPYTSTAYGMGSVSNDARSVTVAVRTTGDPASLVAAVRREMTSIDPTLPVFELAPMETMVRRSMARTTFTALLLTIAAGVSLLLGAIGLYGVVAYMVGARRREIGLRVALGARPGTVSRLLAREGALIATIGVVVGVVAATVVTRVLGSLLYGVSATDPMLLTGTAVLLLAISWTASWLPARRASRVDPAIVLGAD